jgi:hypothetical protein
MSPPEILSRFVYQDAYRRAQQDLERILLSESEGAEYTGK